MAKFYNLDFELEINMGIEMVPTLPYSTGMYESQSFQRRITEYSNILTQQEAARKIRFATLNQNYNNFFPPEFVSSLEREDLLRFKDELGPIFRLCGFNLSSCTLKTNEPLKVLQIGSGPHPSGFDKGPKLDEILRKYGAKVTNMDVIDCSSHYKNSKFIQHNWHDINSFPDINDYDVVFVEQIDPYVGNKENLSTLERSLLLKKTLKSIHSNLPKLFYIKSGICDFDFGNNDRLLHECSGEEGFQFYNIAGENAQIQIFAK